jgi:hypothetical protein
VLVAPNISSFAKRLELIRGLLASFPCWFSSAVYYFLVMEFIVHDESVHVDSLHLWSWGWVIMLHLGKIWHCFGSKKYLAVLGNNAC